VAEVADGVSVGIPCLAVAVGDGRTVTAIRGVPDGVKVATIGGVGLLCGVRVLSGVLVGVGRGLQAVTTTNSSKTVSFSRAFLMTLLVTLE
jgi:hypothetical protein